MEMDYQKAIDYIINRMREELPDNLRYHSIDHTLGVIRAARSLASKMEISEKDLQLLETAAAFHDSGFMLGYRNHEQTGCKIAEENLPQFGFSNGEIDSIKGMIMATKIPQQPKTVLEKILCDADLDYLGRSDYDYISEGLYAELGLNGINLSRSEWMDLQINFLKEHHYWTDFYVKNLNPNKQKVLSKLLSER